MVILISGATRTGKTLLAHKLIRKHGYACISQDLVKMGLIHSGNTEIDVNDTEALRPYLWNITEQMVKTALENNQNLIVEGCYIPMNYRDFFDGDQLADIRFVCLVMSEKYLRSHFDDVTAHADDVERRFDNDDIELERLVECNKYFLARCKECNAPYLLIDGEYVVDWDF